MRANPLRAEVMGSNPIPRPRATEDELHQAWLRGYTSALAALAQFGQDTIYDEVVEAGEPDPMIRQGRRDGAMRWSGLSGYVRRQRSKR